MPGGAIRFTLFFMERDNLFLLPPGFEDNNRREYCPECAEMWGLLHYYPAIRESLEVRYQPIAQPRPGIISLLGEGNWNCPTLVLAQENFLTDEALIKEANGRRYLDRARDIGRYYAARFGTAIPRGSS